MNTERNQTLDLGNCILEINRASKRKSANITFIIPDEVSEKFIKAFVDAARGKENEIRDLHLQLSWVDTSIKDKDE